MKVNIAPIKTITVVHTMKIYLTKNVKNTSNNPSVKTLFFFFFIIASHTAYAMDAISVAAHSNVPDDSLSKQMVKNIFLGKSKTWSNGSAINVCYLDDDGFPAFISTITNRGYDAYLTHWIRKAYVGTNIAPIDLQSQEKIIEFLQSNKGSICYLPNANSIARKEIKTIKVFL